MTGGGHRFAVVGGGLAGITAALRCVDAGAIVTLYEAKPRLGGLTCSFRRGGLWMDNGQHVFLRCCTAYRELLDRLGVAGMTTLQPRMDIAVRSPARSGRLRRTALPAPLHLATSLARYPWLCGAERLRFARAALALRRLDASDARTDLHSFGSWLREHKQSSRAIHSLWELVGIATLNARADDASLALAATVFSDRYAHAELRQRHRLVDGSVAMASRRRRGGGLSGIGCACAPSNEGAVGGIQRRRLDRDCQR